MNIQKPLSTNGNFSGLNNPSAFVSGNELPDAISGIITLPWDCVVIENLSAFEVTILYKPILQDSVISSIKNATKEYKKVVIPPNEKRTTLTFREIKVDGSNNYNLEFVDYCLSA